MAQEKLLFMVTVLIFIFSSVNTNAEAGEELLAEKVAGADREGFKGIMEKSRKNYNERYR